MSGGGIFGPRIIGEEAFKRQQAAVAVAADRFGPRVVDAAAQSKHGERIERVEVPGLSIEQFAQVLDDNNTFLETLYVQELERPDGPRRECLQKARSVAVAVGNVTMVGEIDDLLKDAPPVVPPPDGSVRAKAKRARKTGK